MRYVFGNLMPYKKGVILIIILLAIQAYCDLSMPSYTSEMIDVGIQNKGVEYIIPGKVTKKDYIAAMQFMDDGEKRCWESAFEKNKSKDDILVRKNISDKELKSLEDKLTVPIVLGYQYRAEMKKVSERTLKEDGEKGQKNASNIGGKNSVGQTGDLNGHPGLRQDVAASSFDISEMRAQMKKAVDKIGPQMVRNVAIAAATEMEKNAGTDIDKLQKSYLWHTGTKLFIMALIMLFTSISVCYVASGIGASVGRSLRSKVYSKVMKFSQKEIEHFSIASLITRSTNDIQQIQLVTIMVLRMVLYGPVIGIGGIYMVKRTNAGMSWLIVVGVISITLAIVALFLSAMPKFKKQQPLVDNMNLISREILTGIPVIRAFNRQEREGERFDKASRALMKNQMFTSRIMTLMLPIMMFIMYCLVIAITWVSAHKIDSGNLEVGAMTAFITYSMLIVIAFLMLAAMSIMLPRAGVAAKRINEILEMDISIKDSEKGLDIERAKGTVEFKDVSFRYGDDADDVLSGINFKVNGGETLAIIGSTGSGKSTLVSLIPRFYDVTSGEILIDGKDIRNINLQSLREQLGYVPQKALLFAGTVESNLKFANENLNDDEMLKILDIARMKDFIEGEDGQGLKTAIAQGGSNVSGGQKQRLAIARALAKKPPILIFDDSFSALDMKTDALLRKALRDFASESTKIIVAQRISTIQNADKIIVLDKGRICDTGTHESLMMSCEIYREIAETQLDEGRLSQ